MVATSLAMAPAMLVAQRARFVDLDGPLLLARIARTACATRAAWCIRRRRRCGGDRYQKSVIANQSQGLSPLTPALSPMGRGSLSRIHDDLSGLTAPHGQHPNKQSYASEAVR